MKINSKLSLRSCRTFQCTLTAQNWLKAELYSRVSFEKRQRGGSINCLDIDTKSQTHLLSGSSNGHISIHNLGIIQDNTIQTTGQISSDRALTRVQWYPHDTGLFSSSSLDSSLRIWDTSNLQCVCTFELEGPILFHEMSPAHSLIASTAYTKIVLCDLGSGGCSHTLTAHKRDVTQVRWSLTNTNQLFSSSFDGSVRLWDIRKANACLLETPVDLSEGVVGLTLLADGLSLVAIRKTCLERLMICDNELRHVGVSANLRVKMKTTNASISTTTQSPLMFLPTAKGVEILQMNAFYGFDRVAELSSHFGDLKCLTLKHATQEIFTGGTDGEILGHVRIHNKTENDHRDLDDWD